MVTGWDEFNCKTGGIREGTPIPGICPEIKAVRYYVKFTIA
jgi:hypothetical protein